MEKKKWLWKRKSSESSPCESDRSESPSSHSESYADEQEVVRESSPKSSTDSPEATPKPSTEEEALKESMNHLTEKLSAALVNVGAKEDLVKQHAKVAEEAVAGWEKAEKEVVVLKQQLEAALTQNINLEVRVNHLDGALKECVRQLRQARDDQEKIIADAISEKECSWESTKSDLEKQILELQTQCNDPNTSLLLEALEKENSTLKRALDSHFKEFEAMAVERDLSTQAAELASKSQLESIKKVAKLESECRRLNQVLSRKFNNQKPASPSYHYAESLTDSHSDSCERPSTADIELRKVCKAEKINGLGQKQVDSWASALMAELDQFKNEKLDSAKNLVSSPVDIDMMDDFLEMERIAALPDEVKSNTNTAITTSESAFGESVSVDNQLRAELDMMTQRVAELETRLEKMGLAKLELESSLNENHGLLGLAHKCLDEAENKVQDLQKELIDVKEAKELLEFQFLTVEVESRTLSEKVESLEAHLGKEQSLSTELRSKCEELENELAVKIQETDALRKEQSLSMELRSKCQELENELALKIQETDNRQNPNPDKELKVKQENLAVAADKLAECQKTIASLGQQLQSLATLEDFLIDTSNIPGFSRGLSLPSNGGDTWRLACNNAFPPKHDIDPSRISPGNVIENGKAEESTPSSASSSSSSSSSSAAANVPSSKSRNGFGKFFSRSKSVVELNNSQG